MKNVIQIILLTIGIISSFHAYSAGEEAEPTPKTKMRLIVFDIHYQFMVVETDETSTLKEFKNAIKKKISKRFPKKDLKSLRISLTRGGRAFRECDDKRLKDLGIKPLHVPLPDKNLIINLSAPGIGSVYSIEEQFLDYRLIESLPIYWAILGLFPYPKLGYPFKHMHRLG